MDAKILQTLALGLGILLPSGAWASSTIVGTPVINSLDVINPWSAGSLASVSLTVQNLTANGEEGRVHIAISTDAFASCWTTLPNSVNADVRHYAGDGRGLGSVGSPLLGSNDNNWANGGYRAFSAPGPIQQTLVFTVKMPPNLVPGASYRFHIASNDYFLGVGDVNDDSRYCFDFTASNTTHTVTPTISSTAMATSTPTVTPTVVSNLGLSKSVVGSNVVQQAQGLSYRLAWSHQAMGPLTAAWMEIVDTLPAAFNYISTTVESGQAPNYSGVTSGVLTLRWTGAPATSAGDSGSILVHGWIMGGLGTVFHNTAMIQNDGPYQPTYGGPATAWIATATPTLSFSPTRSPTSGLATGTPTVTDTPTRSTTPTATPTATISATRTYCAGCTSTFTPTLSPTATFTLTATGGAPVTGTLTATRTRTLTPTVSATATPTSTFCPACTSTTTFTHTPTHSATLTATPTLTFCGGCTSTSTRTATVSRTVTPTPTRSVTGTTATGTHTVTHTPTSCGGCTQTLTPTRSMTRTHTQTATPTLTFCGSCTSTSTPTETSADPSRTITPTPTRSVTGTTATGTYTVTHTPTRSATAGAPPSFTPTFTHTPYPCTVINAMDPAEGASNHGLLNDGDRFSAGMTFSAGQEIVVDLGQARPIYLVRSWYWGTPAPGYVLEHGPSAAGPWSAPGGSSYGIYLPENYAYSFGETTARYWRLTFYGGKAAEIEMMGCQGPGAPTATSSPTRTVTPTRTACSGCSPTLTATISRTTTPTRTVTGGPPLTGTLSATVSLTTTRTVTPSRTMTATPSLTYCAGCTSTVTPSVTITGTPTTVPVGGMSTPTRTLVPPGGGGTYPYPNPASGSVNIAIQSPGPGRAVIEIANSRGRLVTRVVQFLNGGLESVPVSLTGFARGVYYYKVRLELDDGRVLRLTPKRFVVRR